MLTSLFPAVLVSLVSLVAMAKANNYVLDQGKLAQRYDLIQAIVSAGVPGKGGAGGYYSKPRIGAAYGNPAIGFSQGARYGNKNAYGAYPGAYSSFGGGYRNPYAALTGKGGYGGYQAPSFGGNSYGSNPYAALSGLKLGGGKVHPLFNNDNLFVKKDTGFRDYDNKDPVYVGGSSAPKPGDLYSQGGFAQKAGVPVLQPQINAYGNKLPSYTGKDAVGSTYTGQPNSIYGNLPGYSNPYFSKY